jgi:hypothetical protein
MARPQKIGLDYFPHDTDASNDMKMQSLLSLCGLAGIGFYWFMIERMYKEQDFMLDVSDTETKQILCRIMTVTSQEYDNYLTVCLKYGLFNKQIYDENQKLCSDGVQKRAQVVIKKRLDAHQFYDQNRQKSLPFNISGTETIQKRIQKRHKVKESKGK